MPRPDHFIRFRAPLVTLLAAAFLLTWDSTGTLRLGLLAALLHECGHILCYRRLLGCWPQVEVSPLGLTIPLRELLPTRLELPLAAAGPLVNLLCSCAVCGWMAWQGASWAACRFAAVNLLLGGTNLLPLSGLDGGRILHCLLHRDIPLACGLLFRYNKKTGKKGGAQWHQLLFY